MTSADGNSPEAAAVAAAEAPSRMSRITLDSGVVLRLKPVSSVVLRSASQHLEQPKVPIVNIEEKGRDEPNPNDPDYLRARAQWMADIANAALNVALILGTEVETVPEGVFRPEDDGWIEDLRAAADVTGSTIDIHSEGKARYLDWLRLYAMATETDVFRLTRVLTTGVLLSEEEVNRAAASFRSLVAGPTDYGTAAAALDVIRDNAPAAVPGDSA